MKYLFVLLLVFGLTSVAFAEDVKAPAPLIPETTITPPVEMSAEEIKAEEEARKLKSSLDSLEKTQTAINDKTKEQAELQRQSKSAGAVEKIEIEAELEKLTLEIKNLKLSFEQIAIGGIKLDAFGIADAPFDWQQELVLITQPVLESLKDLTEKPRNLDRLRSIISDREVRLKEINKAIIALENKIAAKPPKLVAAELKKSLEEWLAKKDDNLREIELAKVQLDNLLGNNEAWYESVKSSAESFFTGRGKTLTIALIAAVVIWQLMKGLLWLIWKKPKAGKSTRRRIFAYLYKFLTTFMIVISTMVVLYVRGDLLLLALMVIIFIGFVLAVRSYLPNYIAEAKTLLDLGTVREEELVIYNGIPWRVHHINVQSILINPEIYGVLRIPLSELVDLKSRPTGKQENWFPCKKGDLLLMPDGAMAEVLSQTPDSVELQTKGGMRLAYTAATVYEMGFHNLTRGDSYCVVSIFGIDYSHIEVSLTEVPVAFKTAVEEGVKQAGLAEHLLDVTVDFKVANSSSLDYIVLATMHSRAASSYFKVGRIIQQSCVKACVENDWGIPFPQLTVHSAEAGS